MKNKILFLLIIIFCISTISCLYGTNDFLYKPNKVENRVDFVHELNDFEKKIDVEKLDNKYKILVLSDTHFGSPVKKTETEPFFNWLDSLDKNSPDYPKFCFILGDNVDIGYKEQYEEYVAFTKKIEERQIPVISSLGNHDLYNKGWENFKEMCYPYCSLFHFSTKQFSWYGIDTGTGDLGIKQYNILKETFENDKKKKIIVMHYPLANSKRFGAISFHDPTERNLLINLLGKSNVTAALCGHLHQHKDRNHLAFYEYGNPSFCYSQAPAWTLYEIDEIQGTVTQLPRNY